MNRLQKIVAGSTVALTLIAATTVFAAGPDGTCDHGGPGMGMMGGERHGAMHDRMMAKHGGPGGGQMGGQMGEQRLAQFKTELKLTAAQEPAWQAFSAKAKEQMASMKDMKQSKADDAKLSAPDRMDQHLAQMTKRMAGMQTMNAAVKDLYAVLTTEQRTAADQHFSHMMGGHRGGGHHMGGPGRGGKGPMGGPGTTPG